MRLPKDERDAMLQNRRRSQGEYYALFKSKRKNKVFLCFCIGFILSGILAISAYLLSYGMWRMYIEDGSDRNFTTLTFPTVPETTVLDSTTSTIPEAVCQRRVVGYWSHWSGGTLANIQLDSLTHIVYMFVFIQNDGSVRVDNGNDPQLEKRFLEMNNSSRVARKKGLKVMLAVGGHFSSATFASTLADSRKKEKLLTSTIDLLDKYDIDGIEVHWTFPSAKDSIPHAEFIKEVRNRMRNLKKANGRSEDYVLSTVTSRNKQRRENILYNEVMKYVDFVSVLPYDWRSLSSVGPITPLYSYDENSVDEAIRDLTCKTRMSSKLNLGVSIFGIHWNNVSFPLNDNLKQMYVPNDGGMDNFSFVYGNSNPGAWINTEPSWHNMSRTPYIWDAKERIFASFENVRSIEEKSSYAWMKNLGGITVYVLEYDNNNTMLDAVSSDEKCLGFKKNSVQFDCSDGRH